MANRDLDHLLGLTPSHETCVPFVRLLPGGQMINHEVPRSREINMLAWRFIAHGGRYLIALVEDNGVEMVRLCAIVPEGDDPANGNILVESRCENGLPLLETIDSLVRNSLDALDDMQ